MLPLVRLSTGTVPHSGRGALLDPFFGELELGDREATGRAQCAWHGMGPKVVGGTKP